MLWRSGRRSDNVEDERGAGGGFGGGGFGGGGIGVRHIGIGGILLIVGIGWFFGISPMTMLQMLSGNDTGYTQDQSASTGTAPDSNNTATAGTDEEKDFVSTVLADTEDTWTAIFKDMGKTYRDPHLVLFSGSIQSACGFAQEAMGPFYCPADSKVYIDLAFYDELKRRFKAPGDFAQAYVIAHEVGHHVQHLLGITAKVEQETANMSDTDANKVSVRVELQADCFAGVWAFHANERKIVEAGDIDEALNAAAAVGDDRLEQESQGYVVPDSFTHGTSEQRVRWFKAGFAQGDLNACDTFNAKTL
jgi:hypothetical protein